MKRPRRPKQPHSLSPDRYVAHSLQVLVKDELGTMPPFDICLDLVMKDGGRDSEVSAEEQACRLFVTNEEALMESIKGREKAPS